MRATLALNGLRERSFSSCDYPRTLFTTVINLNESSLNNNSKIITASIEYIFSTIKMVNNDSKDVLTSRRVFENVLPDISAWTRVRITLSQRRYNGTVSTLQQSYSKPLRLCLLRLLNDMKTMLNLFIGLQKMLMSGKCLVMVI